MPTFSSRGLAAALLSFLLGLPGLAAAADFPDRPVTLVVPFGAGGITDLVARATGKSLAEQLGQPVIVENKPGASGNIAADFLRRAKADGYTLMFTTMGVLAVNPHLAKVNFDSLHDFTFVSLVASTPHVITVNAALPPADLKSLVALARAKPESVTFGTAGIGSSPYQGMQIFEDAADLRFLQVPFKSGVESVTSVVAGQVDMTFEATPVVMPFVKSGKLRALAIANPERIALAPELPSTAELGFPGVVSGSVAGIIGPANMPAQAVARLNAAIRKVTDDAAFKSLLLAQGTSTAASTPDEFRQLTLAEYQRWGKVLGKTAAAK